VNVEEGRTLDGSIDPEEVPDIDPSDEELDQLRAFLSQTRSSGLRVYLYRIRPHDGTPAYLQRYAPSELDADSIARQWGGGKYRATVIDEKGRHVRGHGATFVIDEARTAAAPASSADPDRPPAWLPQLIDALRPTAPAADPLAISRAAAEQMAQMVGLFEILQKGNRPTGPNPSRILEAFERGITLARELGPGGNGADDGERRGGSLPASMGSRLVDIMERALSQERTEPAPRRLPAGDYMQSDVDELADGPADMDPAAAPAPGLPPSPFDELGPFVPRLVRLAGAGADPVEWGALVATQRPDLADLVGNLVDRIGPEGVTARVCHRFPILEGHRGWLLELVSSIAAIGGEDAADHPVEDS
jgi:hypothetical protein